MVGFQSKHSHQQEMGAHTKISISLPEELLEVLHQCKPSYQPLSQFICSLIYEGMEARQEKILLTNKYKQVAAEAAITKTEQN